MKEDKITNILRRFADDWLKADRQWEVVRIGKDKKKLLARAIRELFLKH